MSVPCCKLSLQIKGRTSEEQLCQSNVPFYRVTLIVLSLKAKAVHLQCCHLTCLFNPTTRAQQCLVNLNTHYLLVIWIMCYLGH